MFHHEQKNPVLALCLTLFTIIVLLITGCGNSTSSANQPAKTTSHLTSSAQKQPIQDGDLHIHILNVGQADAALIQINGKNILIDTGDVDHRAALIQQLKNCNVKEIDSIIITHPHGDHLGGMAALFKNFKIHQIYDNGETANTAMFRNYLKQIKELNINRVMLRKGDMVTFDDTVSFTVLAPEEPLFSKNNTHKMSTGGITNNNSIVGKLKYKEFTMLFTGDAQKESEKRMLKDYGNELKSDILKVGHHGSKTSSYSAFIKAVSPKAATISCGAGNEYKFPHKPTLDTLHHVSAEIYRTDQDGIITIISNGESYKIEKEH